MFPSKDFHSRKSRNCGVNYITSLIKLFLIAFLPSASAAILTGQVKDQLGNPISGAQVALFEYQGLSLVQIENTVTVGEDGRYTWTVDDGDFVITSYFYGADVALNGSPYIATLNSEDFSVAGDTTFDMNYDFILFTGNVIDKNGAPIAGVDFNTSKQWEGPEEGSRAKKAFRSVVHQNGSSVSQADGSFTMLVFSTNDCLGSGFYLDPDDCLYDLTITPPPGSGFESTNILDYAINQGQSLTIELDYGDQILPRIVAGPWVTGTSETTATVEWQTDEPTVATVNIDGVGGFNSPGLSQSHRVVVVGLTADTAYTGNILSTDAAGNQSTSANIAFTTLAEPDDRIPWYTQTLTIVDLDTQSMTLELCANEPVTAEIQVDETIFNLTDLALCHIQSVTGLTANTYYQVRAEITDAAGNGPIKAPLFEVTTALENDTQAPLFIREPSVTDVADTTARISWTTDEPATSGVSLNDGTTYQVLNNEALVVEHSVILSGLNADTEYQFQASSIDGLGNGPSNSSTLTFKTQPLADVNAPVILGRPLIEDISHSTALIKWLTDESSTSVIRFGNSQATLDRIATSTDFSTNHQVLMSGLSQNTLYFFQVESQDLSGNTILGDVQQFITQSDVIKPPVNEIRSLSIDRITWQSVTASWQTRLNSNSRLVCESIDGSYEVNKIESTKSHRITLTGLVPDTDYLCTLYSIDFYQLVAIKVFNFKTLEGPDVIAPSCDVSPTIRAFGTTAELYWQTSELVSTSLNYREVGNSEWTQRNFVTHQQSGLVLLTQLSASTDYEHQLIYTDLSGNQSTCPVESFNSGTNPATPVNFTIEPYVENIRTNSATIIWQTDRFSVGEIRYGTSENSLSNVESSSGFSLDHSVVLNSLQAGVTYYFEVDALAANGMSATSQKISFTTQALPLPVAIIDGPTVIQITDSSAVVEWRTDRAATSKVSIDGVGDFEDEDLVTEHSILVTGLSPLTNYTASVTSTDQFDLISDPRDANFTTIGVTDTSLPQFIEGPEIVALSHNQVTLRFCADEAVNGNTNLSGTDYPFTELKTCHEATIKGLTPNTEYSFVCSITDAAGNGPVDSLPITFSTENELDIFAPEIIDGPHVIEISDTSAIVIWTTDEKSDSKVDINDGVNQLQFSDDQLVTEHRVLMTGLTPFTTYTLTVNSTDSLGNGPTVSEPVEFTTLGIGDGVAPIILSGPFVVDITENSAIVIWETDELSTSLVELGTSQNQLDQSFRAKGYVSEHQVSLTKLQPDTLYYLRVTSVDSCGNSVSSEIISFTTAAQVLSLEIIDGPELTAATDSSLTIEWQTNLMASSRLVCESTNGSVEVSRSMLTEKHQLTLHHLAAATNFNCTVYSSDQNDNQVSAFIRVSTDSSPDVIAPSCSGTPEVVGFGTQAEVKWTSSELAKATFHYRVSGSLDWISKSSSKFVEQGAINLTQLIEQTEYELSVLLSDQSGNSASCQTQTFNSGDSNSLPEPEFVIQPIVTDISQNTAVINWETQEASSAIIRYGYSASVNNFVAVEETISQSHSFKLTNLAEGQIYYVQVEALNIEGVATLSKVESFETLHPSNDFDLDGILNGLDNCPYTANSDQADIDQDGIGDLCDDTNDSDINPPLDFGPKLYGLVTGEGAPLENALVTLYSKEKLVLESQLTLADGSYQFKNLTPDTYFIGVTPPVNSGFSATPIQKLVVTDSDLVHWITLIGDAITLSGYLKDNFGRTIDNAWVTLHLQTSANQVGNPVLTDNSGYFEFSVAPGDYQLRPMIDVFGERLGGQSTLPTYPVPDFATVVYAPKNIAVTDNTQIDLVMPLAIMSGQILDSSGSPLAGAGIKINHQFDNGSETYYLQNYADDAGSNAISDQNGNYQFAIFVDQTFELVLTPPASRTDLAATTISNLNFSSDTTQNLSLVDGVALSGKLTDALDRNIDFVKLTLHDQASGVQVGHPVYTNANGDYQFNVEAGEYKIRPHLNPIGQALEGGSSPVYPVPDFATVKYAIENINVSGPTVADIQLPLAILSGKTLDGLGNPIANVALKVSHIEHQGIVPNQQDFFLESSGLSSYTHAKSDANGDFTVALFIDQTFDLIFEPPFENRQFAATQVKDFSMSGDLAQNFVIAEALTLSGYLRDAQGRAIDNTRMTVHDRTNHQTVDLPAFTASDGYFEFKVAPGDYKLRPYLQTVTEKQSGNLLASYSVPDFGAIYYLPDDIQVTAGLQLDVTVPMSLLSGEALDANGVAVPGVKLRVDHAESKRGVSYYLENTGDAAESNAISQVDGSFEFGLYHNQAFDISVNPPALSGFAITNVQHEIDQDVSEHIFLMHFDANAPKIIAGPFVRQITESSAVVEWLTDKPGTSVCNVSNGQSYQSIKLTTYHSVVVTSLDPSTVYSVDVYSVDKENRSSNTESESFTTLSLPDLTPPSFIEGPLASSVTDNGFTIEYCADKPVTGITRVAGVELIQNELAVCHQVPVNNLTPNTPYEVVVEIVDELGNGPTVSGTQTITTAPAPDLEPPVILLNPIVIDISDTEATVVWNTDELSNSGVSYNDGVQFHVVTDDGLVKEHVMQLTDLTPETTYQLTVSSTDAAGNGPTLGGPISFTTLASPDTEAPCLVGVPLIQNITHQSVVIRWWNCEPASGKLLLGTSPDNLERAALRNGLKTFHNVAVTRLEADADYFFKIVSEDAAGNVYESDVYEFRTKVVGHQGNPHFMSDVSLLEISDTTATLSWVTDVNADTRVSCSSPAGTIENSAAKRVKKHLLTLTGLTPATEYACTAYSTDHHGYTAERIVTDSVITLSPSVSNLMAQKSKLQDIAMRIPALVGTPTINAYGSFATLELTSDELSSVLVTFKATSETQWQQVGNLAVGFAHQLYIPGLTTNTDYQLTITLSNIAGETFTSNTYNFNSGASGTIVPPAFTSQPTVSAITTTNAVISFSSQEIAFAQVSYGLSVDSLSDKEASFELVTAHQVDLARLNDATIYYARVTLYNVAGDAIESDLISFTTSALNDTVDSDSDGITDVWEIINNLDPQNGLDAAEDSDNDGLTNLEEFLADTNPFDSDSDNDGMPDGWEVDHDLDPNDPADADGDRNGDGESNLDEYLNAVDTISPVITLPQEATINATGILTEVSGTGVTVTDNLDTDLSLTIIGSALQPSGRHLIYWQAEDDAGNRAIASQMVNINPMVLVREKQYVAEGNLVDIEIQLSGQPPSYPVTFDLSYSGSANASDYSNAPSSITIEEGLDATAQLTIVDDGLTEGEETLSVNLSNFANSTASQFQSHQVIIVENNLPAVLSLNAVQNSNQVTTVTRDGGNVVVTVNINDPNAADSHSVSWSGTDSGITDLDNNPQTITFNPSALTQRVYQVIATVSDNGSPVESATTKLNLKVIDSAPVLLDGVDSDGDGIVDIDEGHQDSDGDGIPDYLDAIDDAHLIQLVETVSNLQGTFWMETNAGLSIALGKVALNTGNGVATIEESDLSNISPYSDFADDEGFDLFNNLFDFVISGIARPGDSVQVVIPQTQTIPENAVYRKLHPVNGWQAFVINNRNQIYSAPGSEGACPSPGHASYQSGLTQGHWCIMLEIEDGGPNDGDQLVDGSILDPGGLAIANAAPTVSIPVIADLEEGGTINLRATVNDNGNQIVSYQWVKISGPTVTINNANQINASVANAPDGDYEFSLTAVDQHNRSVSATVQVTVVAKAVEPEPTTPTSSGGGGSLPTYVIWMLVIAGWRIRKKK